jgi:hypothetical protein
MTDLTSLTSLFAGPLRPHWRMCWREDGLKKRCLSQGEAERIAARTPHLTAYACGLGCGCWHLGHGGMP